MKIYNLIILDASGSMYSIYDQAVSGVNETIQSIKQSVKDTTAEHQKDASVLVPEQNLSLFTFNDGCNYLKAVYEFTPIEKVQEISFREYQTEGCTALYDAIGDCLTRLQKHVGKDDKALVTIVTDGLENASRRYNASTVKEIIDTLTARGYVFTYIGANQDVLEESRHIGISNSMAFDTTAEGTSQMWNRENMKRKEFYCKMSRGEQFSGCFFEEFEEANIRKGNVSADDYHRVTPSRIQHFAPNDVFVFGSDALGRHGGGAAAFAVKHLHAEVGRGEGPQGQAYAIPTVGVTYDAYCAAVARFCSWAQQNPHQRFLVTAIGCGHAGHSVVEMAAPFRDAINLPNVCLPQEFWNFLR